MKKCILFLLLILPSYALAQNPQFNQQYSFTTATTTAAIDIRGRGLNYYRIEWDFNGNTFPSACSIQLQISSFAITWTTASTGTCTSQGQSTFVQASANYLRLNLATFTPASAGDLIVNISGFTTNPSGAGAASNVNIFDSLGNNISSNGTALHVVCDGGTCGGAASFTDNGIFTAGTTATNPVAGFYHATRDSVTDGHAANLAINVNRAVITQIEDTSKNAIPFPLALGAGGGFKIDGSGTALPVSGAVTATGCSSSTCTETVVQPTGTNLHTVVDSGTITAVTAITNALPAGTNVIGHVITDSGSTTAVTGNVAVTKADGSDITLGTKTDAKNAATDGTSVSVVSILKEISALEQAPASQAVTNAGTFAVQAQPTPVTTGGLTSFVLEPAASDNHTVIKNGAGQVYHIVSFNNSATINYLRLYNAGTGFNGCNSATNLAWETHIPANTSDAGFVEDISQGIAFATGISICVTSGYGQTNTTNATATAISISIGYK